MILSTVTIQYIGLVVKQCPADESGSRSFIVIGVLIGVVIGLIGALGGAVGDILGWAVAAIYGIISN